MKKTPKKTSDKVLLTVTKRTVFGKKLASLRREGKIPANIFGPEYKSQSVAVDTKSFVNAYKVAKETAVVYLSLEKEEVPVLISFVQLHPVHNLIVHVDFRKVDLKKKVEAKVPVKTTGVSKAVSQKGGILLHATESLTVEALPADMPQEIVVDISTLKEFGNEIKVADLPKSTTYDIKEPAAHVLVSVIEHKEESITPETTSATPEITTAVPLEGEVAASDATETAKKEGEKTPPPAQSGTKKTEEKK